MGIEVRYVKRSAPRVRTRGTKAGVARRTLRFFKGESQAASEVLDVSLRGMKAFLSGPPLAKGDRLVVKVSHRASAAPVVLEARVAWTRPEPGSGDRYAAGFEFLDVSDRTRAALEQLIALELGSMVSIAGVGHVGFVARGSKDAGLDQTLFVYDLERAELAQIMTEAGYYHATRIVEADVEHKEGDLELLLRWIFGLKAGKVEVQPPIEDV